MILQSIHIYKEKKQMCNVGHRIPPKRMGIFKTPMQKVTYRNANSRHRCKIRVAVRKGKPTFVLSNKKVHLYIEIDAKMKAKLKYGLCCVIRVSEFKSLICKVFFNPTSKEEPVCTEILKGTFEPL